MTKRKFTIITQLHKKHNIDLIKYVDNYRATYAKAVRETFFTIKNNSKFNNSTYNTFLQNKYNITGRTANSIIHDAQGRYNALKELKKYEQKQLERKITNLETNIIPELVQKLAQTSSKQNLRRRIVAKKGKLNKLKQQLTNLIWQIETGKLKLCFGTKHLLQKDYEKFVAQRDSQMSFIGRKNEKSCNLNLQLTHNNKTNQFIIKVRKDFNKYGSDNKHVFGQVYFRHHKNKLVSILRNNNSPLSYKIIKKDNRFYLYCTFEIQVNKENLKTSSNYGTIGLDFNKGFITLAETDKYGNLVQTKFLPYRFKAGNSTKVDLQAIANNVVKLSLKTGKTICIENLSFNTTKAKAESKCNKKYNDMLHSLAYSEFMNIIDDVAYRNMVNVIKVNPAWTSWLAKQKYCPQMKLNTHIGAVFVIARRGQGFKDTI